MEERHKEALRRSYSDLPKLLDYNPILDHLYANRIFIPEDCNRIRAKSVDADKRRELIDTLLRKGPKAYTVFIEALTKSEQHHIVDIVEGHLDVYTTETVLRAKFQRGNEGSKIPGSDIVELLKRSDLSNPSKVTLQQILLIARDVDPDVKVEHLGDRREPSNLSDVVFIVPSKGFNLGRAVHEGVHESQADTGVKCRGIHVESVLPRSQGQIDYGTDHTVTAPDHNEILQSSYDMLLESLYYEDLIPHLQDVFTVDEMNEIATQGTSYERNERFVRLLLGKGESSYTRFLIALLKSHQDYIYNELADTPATEDRLMNDAQKKALTVCREVLVQRMRVDKLLPHLKDSIVLSENQCMTIETKKDHCSKNEVFLSFLMKKGQRAYTEFKEALRFTDQHGVANKLEERLRGTVKVRARIYGQSSTQPLQKDQIIKKIEKDLLASYSVEAQNLRVATMSGEPTTDLTKQVKSLQRLLANHRQLVRTNPGSIEFIVFCGDLDQLDSLWNEYSIGDIEKDLQSSILTDEIKQKYDMNYLKMEVSISLEDYRVCRRELIDNGGKIKSPADSEALARECEEYSYQGQQQEDLLGKDEETPQAETSLRDQSVQTEVSVQIHLTCDGSVQTEESNDIDLFGDQEVTDGSVSLYTVQNVAAAKLLIAEGAQVDATNSDGNTPLHTVKNVEVAKLLIDKGAQVDATNKDGNAPLHMACVNTNIEMLEFLASRSDINLENLEGNTAIHLACECGNIEAVRLLIKKGCNVEVENGTDARPIHLACKHGNVEVVKELISAGCDINKENWERQTPLYIACERGYSDLVGHLITTDTINKASEDSDTPIHLACQKNFVTIAEQLIRAGCNLNKKGWGGKRPIHCALDKKCQDIIKLIAQLCKDPLIGFADGTPLDVACTDGDMLVVTELIASGCDTNRQNHNGDSPLHVSYRQGHTDIVEKLMAVQSDVNLQNQNGVSPLHMACERDDARMVEKLIAARCNVNTLNNIGNAPIHYASDNSNIIIVEKLIAANCDVNLENENGDYPIHLASTNGDTATMEKLIAARCDVNVQNKDGLRPVHIAIANRNKNILYQLATFLCSEGQDKTPMDVACQLGDLHVATELISSGYIANRQNKAGKQALQVAAENGHVALTTYLYMKTHESRKVLSLKDLSVAALSIRYAVQETRMGRHFQFSGKKTALTGVPSLKSFCWEFIVINCVPHFLDKLCNEFVLPSAPLLDLKKICFQMVGKSVDVLNIHTLPIPGSLQKDLLFYTAPVIPTILKCHISELQLFVLCNLGLATDWMKLFTDLGLDSELVESCGTFSETGEANREEIFRAIILLKSTKRQLPAMSTVLENIENVKTREWLRKKLKEETGKLLNI